MEDSGSNVATQDKPFSEALYIFMAFLNTFCFITFVTASTFSPGGLAAGRHRCGGVAERRFVRHLHFRLDGCAAAQPHGGGGSKGGDDRCVLNASVHRRATETLAATAMKQFSSSSVRPVIGACRISATSAPKLYRHTDLANIWPFGRLLSADMPIQPIFCRLSLSAHL